LSVFAWGAIGVASVFFALTCWWLTQDRSVPIYDAGYHLETAINYHNMLRSGDLLGPFNNALEYPPLGFLVGAVAMFIGGVNVSTPIIAENLVFVSLLTLGCYQTGKLLFGAPAGLLAVIFVLGSPLLIAQFHVFMLDAPETALVAVSIWLLLACEDFKRTGVAGLAGLAVGCGLLVKAPFAFSVAGIVVAILVRGGWRNWRGLVAFAAVPLVLGAPWYIDHLSEFHTIGHLTGANLGLGGTASSTDSVPPTLSTANLLWYFWSTLNSQLFVPLFALALGGAIWTISAVVRGRVARGPTLEFLIGGFVAWLTMSLTALHDVRYDMPLLPYLAVIGTGWIVHLPRIARLAATCALVVAVAANTLGTTFGVGGLLETTLVRSPPATQELSDRIVFYSNRGFLVAGPKRDGDVLGLLRALRRNGVTVVVWSASQSNAAFSFEGVRALAMIAGLSPSYEPGQVHAGSTAAGLIHQSSPPVAPRACITRLSDRSVVFVVRHNPASGRNALYCPLRHPQFYE
jgi:4-amino-4-deoxy-L-arabinose transferase-like glycosyltransferase